MITLDVNTLKDLSNGVVGVLGIAMEDGGVTQAQIRVNKVKGDTVNLSLLDVENERERVVDSLAQILLSHGISIDEVAEVMVSDTLLDIEPTMTTRWIILPQEFLDAES